MGNFISPPICFVFVEFYTSLVLIAVLSNKTKNSLKRKGFILLYIFQSLKKGNQDRTSKQGIGHRNRSRGHGRMLLIGLTHSLFVCFFNTIQHHLPRSSTTDSGLFPPTWINNQTHPHNCLQTSLREEFSQWTFPLLRWAEFVSRVIFSFFSYV